MANKSIADSACERGWGMMLPCHLSDDIIVDNHALNGRSSKSFIDEGHWQEVLDLIQPGDYVFIQFGHNDEKPQADRHTDPGTTFDANLRRFCLETRAKGGIPVLFNSVVRRNFFDNKNASAEDDLRKENMGNPLEGDSLIDTHGAYLDSPCNVAKELGVTFVDANKITHDLEQKMGKEGSKKLHMWVAPGTVKAYPKGKQDNTHYNIYGGKIVSGLIMDQVGIQIPALKKYIRHYDYVVSNDGRGDFFSLQQCIDSVPFGKKVIVLVRSGKYPKPKISKGKKVKLVVYKEARIK